MLSRFGRYRAQSSLFILLGAVSLPWPLAGRGGQGSEKLPDRARQGKVRNEVEVQTQLLPAKRLWVYSPMDGRVVRFQKSLKPRSPVAAGEKLILLYNPELALKLRVLEVQSKSTNEVLQVLTKQFNTATEASERIALRVKIIEAQREKQLKETELLFLQKKVEANSNVPGQFWVKAPMKGVLLTSDFREKLTGRAVDPSTPLLQIADVEGAWELAARIPQQYVGGVLQAFGKGKSLAVTLVLKTAPGRTFQSTLTREGLGSEILPGENGADPYLPAAVYINGPDVPPEKRIPRELLLPGAGVLLTLPVSPPRKPAPPPGANSSVRQVGLVEPHPEHQTLVYLSHDATLTPRSTLGLCSRSKYRVRRTERNRVSRFDPKGGYARTPLTTLPCTSVNRKSRPW
jgi:hypothetical protein